MTTATLDTPTRTAWTRLLATDDRWIPLVLRLTLALVIFPHGAQKLLGWFGGYGFAGTMGFFDSIGIPFVFGLLAIVAEFFGALALAAGFLTRIAAFGIGSVMLVAMFKVHLAVGFFMNWTGQLPGEGFEYHLLVLGIVAALLIGGGGKYAVDRQLAAR
jgi:putative oxidoreductase